MAFFNIQLISHDVETWSYLGSVACFFGNSEGIRESCDETA